MDQNEKKSLPWVASLKEIDIYGNQGYMVHHLKADSFYGKRRTSMIDVTPLLPNM
jgi:hypothetical protein